MIKKNNCLTAIILILITAMFLSACNAPTSTPDASSAPETSTTPTATPTGTPTEPPTSNPNVTVRGRDNDLEFVWIDNGDSTGTINYTDINTFSDDMCKKLQEEFGLLGEGPVSEKEFTQFAVSYTEDNSKIIAQGELVAYGMKIDGGTLAESYLEYLRPFIEAEMDEPGQQERYDMLYNDVLCTSKEAIEAITGAKDLKIEIEFTITDGKMTIEALNFVYGASDSISKNVYIIENNATLSYETYRKNNDSDAFVLISIEEYRDNGTLEKITHYNENGTLRIEWLYNENGKNSQTIHYRDNGIVSFEDYYDANGTLTRRYHYYENGKIKQKTYFAENGKIMQEVLYDIEGNIVKVIDYDENGDEITTEQPTETPTPTDAPTVTPEPTETPIETPEPTETPTETPTSTPAPTEYPSIVINTAHSMNKYEFTWMDSGNSTGIMQFTDIMTIPDEQIEQIKDRYGIVGDGPLYSSILYRFSVTYTIDEGRFIASGDLIAISMQISGGTLAQAYVDYVKSIFPETTDDPAYKMLIKGEFITDKNQFKTHTGMYDVSAEFIFSLNDGALSVDTFHHEYTVGPNDYEVGDEAYIKNVYHFIDNYTHIVEQYGKDSADSPFKLWEVSTYREDGTIEKTARYSDGILYSEDYFAASGIQHRECSISYYTNGNKETVTRYNENHDEISYESYYENGTLKSEMQRYDNGAEKYAAEYREDGTISYEATFYESGIMEYFGRFDESGNLIESAYYDKNGNPITKD